MPQLLQLGLAGTARAFAELDANRSRAALSHAEWLALLLDREATERHDRRLRARLRACRGIIERLARVQRLAARGSQ